MSGNKLEEIPTSIVNLRHIECLSMARNRFLSFWSLLFVFFNENYGSYFAADGKCLTILM